MELDELRAKEKRLEAEQERLVAEKARLEALRTAMRGLLSEAEFEERNRRADEAQDLIDSGRLDEAEEIARKLAADYPKDPVGPERLGQIDEARGMVPSSVDHYRRAVGIMDELGEGRYCDCCLSVGAHSAGLSSTQSDGTRSFERTIRREAGEGGGMADRGGRRGAARPCQRQGCRAELLLRRHASWSDAPEREDAGVSRFRSHRVLGLWEWGNGDRPRSATCELVAAVGSDDTPVGDERREGVAHGRGADLGEVTDLAMGHGRGRVGQNPFDTLEG
jgi:hypothetical protein